MATVNTHQNNALRRHATSWKQRLGLGVVAWVALGVATALLDPRHGGAGVIGLCGGFGAWLATGVGLAAAYTVAHIAHRRAGVIAGLAAGVLSLLVVGVLLVAVDWNAVLQGVFTVIFGAIVVALSVRSSTDSSDATNVSSADDTICGWRNDGPFGPGYYAGDLPLEDDE